MTFSAYSSEFEYGESIPRHYSCEGPDVSPPLGWENVPDGTESFALIMEDPDAPGGTWVHWVVYDIPVKKEGLQEGDAAGISGVNSFGKEGYGGPCPPPGHGPHRYFFKLYALDTATISEGRGADAARVKAAMSGHIIAIGEYMGKYERK